MSRFLVPSLPTVTQTPSMTTAASAASSKALHELTTAATLALGDLSIRGRIPLPRDVDERLENEEISLIHQEAQPSRTANDEVCDAKRRGLLQDINSVYGQVRTGTGPISWVKPGESEWFRFTAGQREEEDTAILDAIHKRATACSTSAPAEGSGADVAVSYWTNDEAIHRLAEEIKGIQRSYADKRSSTWGLRDRLADWSDAWCLASREAAIDAARGTDQE